MNKKIIYAVVIAGLMLLIGTMYYHSSEGWTYTDSFYFSTITLTTIGYGDLAPAMPNTRLFTSFYAMVGIGVMLYLLGSVVGEYLFKQEQFFERVLSKLHRKNNNNNLKPVKK